MYFIKCYSENLFSSRIRQIEPKKKSGDAKKNLLDSIGKWFLKMRQYRKSAAPTTTANTAPCKNVIVLEQEKNPMKEIK